MGRISSCCSRVWPVLTEYFAKPSHPSKEEKKARTVFTKSGRSVAVSLLCDRGPVTGQLFSKSCPPPPPRLSDANKVSTLLMIYRYHSFQAQAASSFLLRLSNADVPQTAGGVLYLVFWFQIRATSQGNRDKKCKGQHNKAASQGNFASSAIPRLGRSRHAVQLVVLAAVVISQPAK